MEKKLERRKKAIEKRLTRPNTREEFNNNIDGLSTLEIRQRYYDKKRSNKLRVRVPA